MIYSKFQIICIPHFQIIQILNVLKFLQLKQRLPFWELNYGHWVYLAHEKHHDMQTPMLMGSICLFCCFTSQVNSYGHDRMVSSPNHTFSLASLNKQLTSTSCTYLTDNNPSWMIQQKVCLFIFVALRPITPMSTAMVIAGRSVHLTTLFPGQAWASG